MKIQKNNQFIYFAFLLVLLGCLPLLWLRGNYIINGGDINFSLNPLKEFYDRLFAWNPYYNGGIDNCINFGSLPFCIIKVCFYFITNSITWTQKLIFIFWYAFMGISIITLAKDIFPKDSKIAYFFSIIFYLINLYQFLIWRNINITAISALATVPLLMSLIIKFFKKRKNIYLLAYAIVSVFWGITSINPPVFILTFALLVFFIIYLIHQDFRKNLKSAFAILAITLAVNSYCLMPLLYKYISIKDTKETIIDNYNAIRYLNTQSTHSDIISTVRLMGNSEFYFTWKDDPYYPSFKHFLRKRSIILGFILPLLALIGTIKYRKEMYIKFFFFITLLGIILSMGIHQPMTNIYLWAFKNIPLFWLFRSPWLKFSFFIVLGYSILAPLGCQYIYNKFKKYNIGLLSLLFICIIYLYFMHPFLLGKMLTEQKDHIYLKPTKISVPNYIYDFSNWINKQKGDFNVLLLPDEKLSIYDWGYMGISDITEMLLNKGILHREYGERGMDTNMETIYNDIIDNLYNNKPDKLFPLLQTARVEYICQRNDFQYDFYEDTDSPSFIKDILKKQNQIMFFSNFGQWDIYKVLKKALPLIDIKINSGNSITPTIHKNNPTDYKIIIKDKIEAEQTIDIIFRENFSPEWRAYINKSEIKKHYKYDNYANAWETKGLDKGNLKISLIYFPQKIFYLGLLMTSIILILIGVVTFKNRENSL